MRTFSVGIYSGVITPWFRGAGLRVSTVVRISGLVRLEFLGSQGPKRKDPQNWGPKRRALNPSENLMVVMASSNVEVKVL